MDQERRSKAEKYRVAAEAGDPEAQYQLGLCFYRKDPEPEDPAEREEWLKGIERGLVWLRKAGNQGHPAANEQIGFCYWNGKGLPHSHRAAMKRCLRAAKAGMVRAQWAVGCFYLNGGSHGISENCDEGVRWMHKAAVAGDPCAQYMMALTCKGFWGQTKNLTMGLKWHELAAKQGEKCSLSEMADYYYEGRLVQQDLVKAYAYISLAIRAYLKRINRTYAFYLIRQRKCFREEMALDQVVAARKLSKNISAEFNEKFPSVEL